MAAAQLAHVEVGSTAVQLASYRLGTGDEGSGVVQEVKHMALIVGPRMLVGNEPNAQMSSLALAANHLSQDGLLADAHRVEALAQPQEETVEPLILQWLIHLPLHSVAVAHAVKPQRYRCHPLPVAVVGGIEHYALAVVEGIVNDMGVVKHQALAHLVIADVQQFEGLDHIVGEVVVKLFLNGFALLLALLGEALGKVLLHHLPAVAYQVIGDEVEHMGMQVEHPPRHQCQQVQAPSQGSV